MMIADGGLLGLVIDTETNGIPDSSLSADDASQPRLAQLSMLFLDDTADVIAERNFYVRPDGWSMTWDATAVNGLTDEFLQRHGHPISVVLATYSAAIKSGRYAIGHNVLFDLKIMRGELRRAGLDDLFHITPNICTMNAAKGVIANSKRNSLKVAPSLNDCRDHLRMSKEGAHRGMKDAADALHIFRYLRSQCVDLTPTIKHSRRLAEIGGAAA